LIGKPAGDDVVGYTAIQDLSRPGIMLQRYGKVRNSALHALDLW
jgi:hypothetical protein